MIQRGESLAAEGVAALPDAGADVAPDADPEGTEDPVNPDAVPDVDGDGVVAVGPVFVVAPLVVLPLVVPVVAAPPALPAVGTDAAAGDAAVAAVAVVGGGLGPPIDSGEPVRIDSTPVAPVIGDESVIGVPTVVVPAALLAGAAADTSD